ncbi:hypothetical protein D3C71_2003740 [compost metagenome]
MRIMSIAAAAAFSVMASSGLARAAPQPVRRGQLHFDEPIILNPIGNRLPQSARPFAAARRRPKKSAPARLRAFARSIWLVASWQRLAA